MREIEKTVFGFRISDRITASGVHDRMISNPIKQKHKQNHMIIEVEKIMDRTANLLSINNGVFHGMNVLCAYLKETNFDATKKS